MNTPTIGDLFEFIKSNKGTTTFINNTDEEIAGLIIEGVENHTLLYSTDNNNKINGMILAVKDVERKILFIVENLSMSIHNLRTFAKVAKAQLPDYTIQAYRHGCFRKFNTEKLYSKLKA